MKEQAENADSVESDVNNVEAEPNFAAVPIHFRPKEGASKLIKLVIPGIEPPLGFFRVEGDSPESLTMTVVDGPSDVQGDKDVEKEIDQDADEQPAEDIEPSDPTPDEEETETEDLDYPHEDESGNPVAGFLLGSEEVQPLVIVVRPEQGQTAEEAMKEEGEKHPEHMPGSLDEAKKLLGHSPLTAQDN